MIKLRGYIEFKEEMLLWKLGSNIKSNSEYIKKHLKMCRRILDAKTLVISAFPGTGKSYYFKNSDLNVKDSDSSTFDKSKFPDNYIRHIQDHIGKVDIIMVSSHEEVRDALVSNKIDFVLVYPDISLKNEYIKRFNKRGNPEAFISLLSNNWDNWITNMDEQADCVSYKLQSKKYLSNILI
jgi:hypothetical protein